MDCSVSATRQPPLCQLPSSIQPTSPPPGSLSLAICCMGQRLPQYSSRSLSPGGRASAKSTVTSWISRGSSQVIPCPGRGGMLNGAASKGTGDGSPRSGQARADAAKNASHNLGFTASKLPDGKPPAQPGLFVSLVGRRGDADSTRRREFDAIHGCRTT